jgi:hypothetical protein
LNNKIEDALELRSELLEDVHWFSHLCCICIQ